MTNEEKIKAMSTDEFVRWIMTRVCKKCSYCEKNCSGIHCFDGIKEWLKEEAEYDT